MSNNQQKPLYIVADTEAIAHAWQSLAGGEIAGRDIKILTAPYQIAEISFLVGTIVLVDDVDPVLGCAAYRALAEKRVDDVLCLKVGAPFPKAEPKRPTDLDIADKIRVAASNLQEAINGGVEHGLATHIDILQVEGVAYPAGKMLRIHTTIARML
jgi:hypothetical protein